MKFMSPIVAALLLVATDARAMTLAELAEADAKDDLVVLETHVTGLLELAYAHVEEVGLAKALADFDNAPWRRDANALHVWGVTLSGVHWYDAGHPELVGLNVTQMSDLEGVRWAELAVEAATGAGDPVFRIVYPHPSSLRAATGLQSCVLLKDGERALCTGAFEDPQP